MRIVENFTELNKIKLNQLFKYINNHILQAIHSKKYFYCFDSKKNIKSLDHKMTMGLMEAKKIVDDLTIQYDMNNIYRIRLVE